MADQTDVATDPASEVDMTGRYNTNLSPMEEQQFNDWSSRQRSQGQRDPSAEMYDYDIKGWWKQAADKGAVPDLGAGHLGDQFKKPNHPTFSDESIYHGVDGHEGGHWGGQEPNWTFTPGKTNLQFFSGEELQDYFKKREPASKLITRDEFSSDQELLPEEMKAVMDAEAGSPSAIPPIGLMQAGQYVKTSDLTGVAPSTNIERRGMFRGPVPATTSEQYSYYGDLRRQREKDSGGSAMGKSLGSESDIYGLHLKRLIEIANEKTPLPRRRPKGK